MLRLVTVLCLIALAGGALLAARAPAQTPAAAPAPSSTPLYAENALPPGPVGESIKYGHDLMIDTKHMLKGYVVADLNCADCHVDAGLKARGGSFIGTYARFPQWNKRSGRVIALQDRLTECFLYSENGRPPAYHSKEMIALVAYIAWLSRGTPTFSEQDPHDRFIEPLPSASPRPERGAETYAQRCAKCHQADGAGIGGTFPPLWGPKSFNNGAGMAHIDRMTGFVHYNMPRDEPGTLTLEQAYDVSAWILGHDRPKFQGTVPVAPSPEPAQYF